MPRSGSCSTSTGIGIVEAGIGEEISEYLGKCGIAGFARICESDVAGTAAADVAGSGKDSSCEIS